MLTAADTPFSFILFGASGHLATIKIYPALYVLALKKRLPKDYVIVGYARTEMDDMAFRKMVEESVRKDMSEVNEKVLTDLLKHMHYVHGQYMEAKDFTALAKALEQWEKGGSWVRLAYLSIPPTVFTAVFQNLCKAGIHNKKNLFRCIVEKPVGHDLGSFEEIRHQLTDCFDEKEIFLLDHYLGKEAVRNIYYLRASNPVLERVFKNTLIHHVEVTASEPAGIAGRAGYYEHTGAFRDMFQSHLLEMCSLLTMRQIEEGESFRESRQNALEQFYLPPAGDLDEIVLQGQYEGYEKEEGIAKGSKTNTYATLKLLSRSSRWQGVPFYLRSGKKLAKKETRISIQFQPPSVIWKGSTPNRLDIILQGEAGMRLHLQTKIGGSEPEFRPLIMEDPLVCLGDCLPEHGLLLLEAIDGRQQWFLRFNEVQASWRLLDPIQAHLDRPDTHLYRYKPGSKGPMEAEGWIARDATRWLS
ncbi:glucose-6-phosphate dehydrogenase (NADP(+)) [Candidatus Peregrinibacteria bacterium]|nr:glucose-6-phosphate dehydrogenase (NADP(+)) [Candidatus Peregrinibacteria bacterium]